MNIDHKAREHRNGSTPNSPPKPNAGKPKAAFVCGNEVPKPHREIRVEMQRELERRRNRGFQKSVNTQA